MYNTNLTTQEYANFFNLPVMIDYPAVTIYEGDDHINFNHDDTIHIKFANKKVEKEFCIMTKEETEQEKGSPCKFGEFDESDAIAFGFGTVMKAEYGEKEHAIGFKIGDTIRIKNKKYTIAEDHNWNIKFIPA